MTAASLRLKLSDDTRRIKPEMVWALIYEAVNVSDKIQPSVLLRPFSAILENVDFSPRNISPRYSYLPSHYVFPRFSAQ